MEELDCWQINLQHSKTASATLVADIEKQGKPCLVLIQEPHVYKNNIRNLYVKDHSLITGGNKPRAAILCPRTLPVTLVDELSGNDFTCGIINTQLNSKNMPNILLISGYLDINFDPQVTADQLQHIFDYAKKQSLQILMGVDSNAWSTLWGSKETNKRGEVLEELFFKNDVLIVNRGGKPTFVTCRASSTIDLTLTSSGMVDLVRNWEVLDDDTLSDHKKISFKLTTTCPNTIIVQNVNNTNWNLFNELINNIELPDPPQWTTDKLDNEVNHFNQVIKYAFDKACPPRTVKLFKKKQPSWWSDEIQSQRHMVRTKYQKANFTMLEEDLAAYKEARKSYKNMIKTAKRQGWRDFASGVNDTKDMARLFKTMQGSRCPKAGLFRDHNGIPATETKTSIQSAFDALFPGNQEVSQTAVSGVLCTRTQMLDKADFITEDKIVEAIKSFKSNKSPGIDGIKPLMLKKLSDKGIKLLKQYFKASVTLSYVPKAWRETKVALLPKPNKDKYDKPSSYRPISLTSFAFKTLERVVLWHIEDVYLTKKPISKHQHAYLKKKSCDTALSELVNRLERGTLRGQFALGVFLDIQGAFNYVLPEKVREAMNKKGLDSYITRWYNHYLTSRMATIQIDDTKVTRKLPMGVPQGGIISPLAWDLVIDELLTLLNEEKNVIAVGFADDIALAIDGQDPSSMVDIVQKLINKACDWGRGNNLNFNAAKTEAVFFTRKRKVPKYKPIKVNGETVEYADGCKYLGVYLDSKLNWKKHIQLKINKCKTLLHLLKAMVGRKWGTNPQLVRWAFTGIVRPTLSYACHIWWKFCTQKSTISQLNRLNRLACLSIAKVQRSSPTKGLEMIYNLLPLDLFLEKQTLMAYIRVSKIVKSNWSNPGGEGHLGELQKDFQKLKLPNIVEETKTTRIWNKLFKVNLDFGKTKDDSQEYKNQLHIYTDGSKIDDGKAGYGFVVRNHYQTLESDYGYLGKEATVFQSEIKAILEAALTFRHRNIHRTKIVFRVDSQASVLALASPNTNTQLVLDCVQALQHLANKCRVEITWIKAHVGHTGNELADEAAKAGAMLKVEGPEPFLELPKASVKKSVTQLINNRWERRWNQSTEYIHTKYFIQRPTKLVSRNLGQLSREQLSLLVQVITGHCNLLYHSRHYSSEQEEDTLCRLCLEEDEKPWHILTDCPALHQRRLDHFGWASVLTNNVSWTPKRLLAFFTEHSIQQLFNRLQ